MPRDLFAETDELNIPQDLLADEKPVSSEIGLIHSLAHSIPVKTVLGAGDALHNDLADSLNFFIRTKIPHVESDKGLSYDAGNLLGHLGAFLGGGEALEGARVASKAVPYLGKAAEALEGSLPRGILKRSLGGALYGGITTPDNRVAGAAIGGAGGAALESLGVLKNLPKHLPDYKAKRIISELSEDSSYSQNMKDIAQSIRNLFDHEKSVGKDLYDSALGNLRDSKMSTTGYKTLDPEEIKNYGRDVKKLHNKFTSNPTIDNAHKLQSQLGEELRNLAYQNSKGTLDASGRDTASLYDEAREKLKEDIKSNLASRKPGADKAYDVAAHHWYENVAPFTSKTKLAEIASGKITNPGKLSTLFKNPEEPMLEIFDKLGPRIKDKLILGELGKVSANKSAKSLIDNYNKLDEKGLNDYISDNLREKMNELINSSQKYSRIKKIAGITSLGSLGGGIEHKIRKLFD